MSDQAAQEPTMEEILASIRRIISEDDALPEPQTAAESHAGPVGAPEVSALAETPPAEADTADDDVLELTERVPEPAPEPVHARAPEPQPVEQAGDLDIFERPAPSAAPAPAPPPVAAAPAPTAAANNDDGLLSTPVATAAASAFGSLANRVSLPADGQTLEDVVRDLLRPMLRDWLDRNLQGIVEQRVQAEVDRISRLNVR